MPVTWGALTGHTWGSLHTWADPLGSPPPAPSGPPATWRPDMSFQVSFDADPNDPAATPTWTDLTNNFVSASAITRGRQYELDITQPAQPTISLRDPDEYLNPANTGSPYYPHVLPYRQALWQAVWPNPCAGNLLNAGTWRPNDALPVDPTFDSYAVGTTPWWLAGFGNATAVVNNTFPRSGANDILIQLTTLSTFQGVSLQIPCIPGRQYTASGYVNLSVTQAHTVAVGISGGATGTSTTVANTYIRLSVTFTATQPQHLLLFFISGTPAAGNFLLDDVQLEQAATASAFTTTGSVIYPVTTPLIERWPRVYNHTDSGGFEGFADVIGVDQLAALSKIQIATAWVDTLRNQYTPDYWWPMSEPSGSLSFAEVNNGPPLVPKIGPGQPNAGTATAASSINIVGDPGGPGVEIQGSDDTSHGLSLLASGLTLTTTGTTWALTIAVWASFTDITDTFGLFALINKNGNMLGVLREGPPGASNPLFGGTVYVPFGGFTNTSFAGEYVDGQPHYFVATFSLSSNVFKNTLYVDGVSVGTSSDNATTAFGTNAPVFSTNTLNISSGLSGSDVGNGINGVYAGAAIWRRALSAAEVLDLWHAGGLGYAGQTSGAQVTQHLVTYGQYTGDLRINAGTTIMGAPSYTNYIDLLTDTQNTAVAEGGNVWAAPDGTIVFEGRTQRWYRLTSMYTFGEDVDSGEFPYQGDIEFDYDPTFVYANVQIGRSGSVPMTGGTPTDIGTATKRYYNAAYSTTEDVLTDAEAQDQANYVFYTHNNPIQRVNTITLNPASWPALWPVILSIELGQRVTVKRRATAANGGTGITMSGDFFVENISHNNISMSGSWTTTLQLSPIGSATNSPPVTFQPGILNNSTLGILDSTMVIAW